VHAAHDAAGPPLVVRDGLDRLIGIGDARVGKDEEVEPGERHQPELPKRDGAEVVERIQLVAEGDIENAFDAHEEPLHGFVYELEHVCLPGWSGNNLSNFAEYKASIIFHP